MPIIQFNIPLVTGKEIYHIRKVKASGNFSGDGPYNIMCQDLMEKELQCNKVFLTPSCTHALEMAAILADIKEGDEVIMPSFTFPSSANAFVLRGANIIFVDIDPLTMNIDENLIEDAITERTKVILIVHYGGVSCEMDKLLEISGKHNILLIEDAAHSYKAKYKNKYLGTIGDIGCISFHETKNIHCGEGGAILINNKRFAERAEIIREKGTNRKKFIRGEIDKYTWIDIGSSFLLSELNAAFLYPQLKIVEKINQRRLMLWQLYRDSLNEVSLSFKIELAQIPDACRHNGNIFYLKTKDSTERENLIRYLNNKAIFPAFHYLPLHTSYAGKLFGKFHGEDKWTSIESSRLLRLPMFYTLKKKEILEITDVIKRFYLTKVG